MRAEVVVVALLRVPKKSSSVETSRGATGTLPARPTPLAPTPAKPLCKEFVGNGPNTVSGSTVSNTELSEFFWAH